MPSRRFLAISEAEEEVDVDAVDADETAAIAALIAQPVDRQPGLAQQLLGGLHQPALGGNGKRRRHDSTITAGWCEYFAGHLLFRPHVFQQVVVAPAARHGQRGLAVRCFHLKHKARVIFQLASEGRLEAEAPRVQPLILHGLQPLLIAGDGGGKACA